MIWYSELMQIIKTHSFEIAANIFGDDNASRVAILMPGRLDTKDYISFTIHAEYLAQRGYLVAAIDMPGTWDSPGSLSDYTTSTYIQVINELIEDFGNRPTLLLGHSRGGATAMLVSTNPAVAAIVVVNAAYGNPSVPEPEEVVNGFLREERDLPPGNVRTEVKVSFELPMNYFNEGARHNPVQALKDFKKPKLLIHATEDEFVSVLKVKEIYETLGEPKSFREIDGTHDYRLFPEVIQTVNDALGKFLE